MTPPERPSRESVLDAFAVEREPNRSTLEHYLRLYPEYAAELVDLSRELSHADFDEPLSDSDQASIDAAWTQHTMAAPTPAARPFAGLTADNWRAVAQRLEVPRQVVTALREGRVSLVSIPKRFLDRLAEALDCTVLQLLALLGSAPPLSGRTYKADGKPVVPEQITFEQVLIEAGVPAEKRGRLLAEDD